MFCKNCGTQVPEGTRFCPSCGCSLTEDSVADRGASPQQTVQKPGRPTTYLALSIIITILCCLPFGIVGIVYASGKAEIRRINGVLLRTLEPKDAVDISFSGDQVAIRMSNGKTRVRKAANGVLVRTI